jgi:signal transduction histidine kinase
MERLNLGLEQRAVLGVVLIHVLALPILAWLLLFMAQGTLTASFVQRARTLARGVADGFEIPSVLKDSKQTSNLLDSVILTGEGVYAELFDNGRGTLSVLNRAGISYAGRQDLEFFEDPGTTYFIVLPINIPGHRAEVRMGFDKRPTLDNIAQLRWNSVKILVSYAVLSLGLTVVFVRQLTGPLAKLRRLARQVASGEFERQLATRTSIPEVRELTADLETMRGELVGVNAKLRAEMRERQKVESQRKQLESELQRRQRMETLGTLARGIAHEINNSLVPILVYAKVVCETLPPESSSREYVLRILQSAGRSKEVIRKMLTFSRQLDGVELARMSLIEPVNEAVRLFVALASPGVSVVEEVEADCAPVLADATLINLLIMNLCNNALQAMRAAGGTLTVTLRRRSVTAEQGSAGEAAPDYVELRVQDTGHGMDEATLDRIFEPFFTTREPGEGNGLGLPMVHGIAASCGATVLVDSTPGVGSVFTVLFPIAPDSFAGGD